jgi:hypothetical protein
MLSLIQIASIAAASVALVALSILTSESFAFAVSRVLEAAFDRAEHALALRARTRTERLKSRRREERRRALRAQGERLSPQSA